MRSRGIELDIGGEILPGWNIFASAFLNDSIVTEGDEFAPEGNTLANSPKTGASLWTTYEIQSGDFQGLGFGFGLFYVGDREVEIAKSVYPSWQIEELSLPKDDRYPIKLGFLAPNANENLYQHGIYEIFVNSYTGKVMGNIATRFTFYRFLLNLHYRLFLPGKWAGRIVTGIAALFLLVTAMTGIVLWPSWRKLAAGFKIKGHAHIKRLNFDIHKVVGILAAIFLIFTAFTGIYLNFYDWINPAIYALTASTESESKLPTISDPKFGQTPILPSVAIALVIPYFPYTLELFGECHPAFFMYL